MKDTAFLTLALAGLLTMNACSNQGFRGDYHAAAVYCDEQGAHWFRIEDGGVLSCFQSEQPGSFSTKAVLAEDRTGPRP